MKIAVLLVSTSMLLIGCTSSNDPVFAPPENLETTIQYDNVPGVDPNLNSLDIFYTSSQDKRPVVIWVHGGAWAIGG